MCSQRSELAITLVAARPEDAFIDLIGNSILGVIILSIGGQNRVLNPVFDHDNNINHFPVNRFTGTYFQVFHNYHVFFNCWTAVGITNGEFLVSGTFLDRSKFFSIARSTVNNDISVKVI